MHDFFHVTFSKKGVATRSQFWPKDAWHSKPINNTQSITFVPVSGISHHISNFSYSSFMSPSVNATFQFESLRSRLSALLITSVVTPYSSSHPQRFAQA